MTLFPMPGVIDPKGGGKLIVTTNGVRHVIICGADPISQRAVVRDEVSEIPKSKKTGSDVHEKKQGLSSGTSVRIEWTPIRSSEGTTKWPFGDGEDWRAEGLMRGFRELCVGFAMFNPHLTLHVDWFGKVQTFNATDPQWKKWLPTDPTSPHWYELRHLERLIAGYITHDRDTGDDRLVSDFLREFDGLSGSGKRTKVLTDADMKRVRLSELVTGDRLDSGRIAVFLAAMQKHTRPVASRRLGIIGEEHFRAFLIDGLGCKPESFRYSKRTAEQKVKKLASIDGDKACFIPWCLECVFGYLDNDDEGRRIFTGANFSASIRNPFRSFGGTGEGLEATLHKFLVGSEEPVVFVLHLVHPRVEYTDRGKSAFILGERDL